MNRPELEARIKDLEHAESELRQAARIAGATIEGLQAGIAALIWAHQPAAYPQAIEAATRATDTLNTQMTEDGNDDEYQQISRAALDSVLHLLTEAALAAGRRSNGPTSDPAQS
jgi:hypothetical protein